MDDCRREGEGVRLWVCLVLAVLTTLAIEPVRASDRALPVPRFASLSSDKVYMREGPTYRHPILWVYHRKGLPVEILSQYDVWRRVRDPDGAVGWMHSSMIAEVRTVLVTAKSSVRRDSDPHSRILALAQPGVIAKLLACEPTACEIAASGTEGWIDRKNIWGVRTGEVFR